MIHAIIITTITIIIIIISLLSLLVLSFSLLLLFIGRLGLRAARRPRAEPILYYIMIYYTALYYMIP